MPNDCRGTVLVNFCKRVSSRKSDFWHTLYCFCSGILTISASRAESSPYETKAQLMSVYSFIGFETLRCHSRECSGNNIKYISEK
jgi:hypothetical protein